MEPENTPQQRLAEVAPTDVRAFSQSISANLSAFAASMATIKIPSITATGLGLQQNSEALAVMKRLMMPPVAGPLFDIAQFAAVGKGLAVNFKLPASLVIDLSKVSFATNIGDVFAKSLPFIEQILKSTKRYAEIKDTALEVYEREEKLYLEEYGLSVPYENFWKWFVSEHDDFPIWEVFDAITYESIANDYGRYIAETRYKRLKNQSQHFDKISLPTPILINVSDSHIIKRPLEYIASKEFREGNSVKHATDLANDRFGYVWYGYPFYSGMALAIMESDAVPVQQRLHNPENTGEFLMVDTTIDGADFFDSYVEGFRKGIADFEKDYAFTSAIIYGPGSNAYVSNLHNLYKHGPDNLGFGWEWEAKSPKLFITQRVFLHYGYYAALCHSVDLLVQRHPNLSEAIYNCNNDDTPTTSSREGAPVTLSDASEEKIDSNGGMPTPDEMRRAVREVLAPLNGCNPQRERIMSEDNFTRLIEYADHLALTGDLPANIQIIEKTGISAEHIRYTFFRLHDRLFTTRRRHHNFYHFLKCVFRQLETHDIETTHKKFRTPPASYFTDFNVS